MAAVRISRCVMSEIGNIRGELGLVAGVAVILFAAQAMCLGLCLQDDAFISLRYARNLAEGHGLVFNLGERVEGYTNFLWTLALAAPFGAGWDPISFLLAMGVASGLAAMMAACVLARELAPDRALAGGLAALFTAGAPFLVAESLMGLETAAFAAFSTLGVSFYLRESRRHAGFVTSAACLAAACLTRPEGMLVSALVGLHDLAGSFRAARRRGFWYRWLLVTLVVGAHLTFRVVYYGDLVPNTFHAKVGGGVMVWWRGLANALRYLWGASPLLLLGALGAASAPDRRDGLRAGSRLVAAIALAYMAYAIFVGGDYKPTFRFFALPTVLLAALAGVAVSRLGESRSHRASAAWIMGTAAASVAALLALGDQPRGFARYRADVLADHRAAGAWLRDAVPEHTWIAMANVGVIPYESRLPTIDTLGLCDRHIARAEIPQMGRGMAGHEKSDARYVLDHRPAVIMLQDVRFSKRLLSREEIEHGLGTRADLDIWHEPRFTSQYRLRTKLFGKLYLHYFERTPDP